MMNLNLLQRRQQGTTLVASLVVLTAMTIIGVSSMRVTSMGGKIAKNMADVTRAFHASETGVVEGEQAVEALTTTSGFSATNGYYDYLTSPDPFTAGTWVGTTSIQVGTNLGTVPPRYFIEYVGDFDSNGNTAVNVTNYGNTNAGSGKSVFRIVSRGYDATGRSKVTLESYFGAAF